jgi:hypothetical protein
VTLFSTKDDFCGTTLASISSTVGKLDYLSGLRDADGRYHHWGLARIYGEEAAQRAIAEVHRVVFLEFLRMPLHKVLEDAARASAEVEKSLRVFVEELSGRCASLVPPELGGGSLRHFNSVVSALLALVRNSRVATPAGA